MASSTVTFSYHDKVVIVTGGNSGIGLATANEFLKAGAKVAVFDIRPPTVPTQNENRLDITCDVGVEESAEAAVAQVLDKWGTIDILCNIAGIMDAMARVSECETTTWDRCFRVNVTGPFLLMRACTKHFLTKPKTDPVATRGSIVNICSTASKVGSHAGVAYTASKHAILGLGRSTAFMYAKEGIRCNSILPGGAMTNIVANSGYADAFQTSLGMAAIGPVHGLNPGLVDVDDLARTVLYVAGNESMNGAEIPVDKGWTTL